jgi:hypothetical protein
MKIGSVDFFYLSMPSRCRDQGGEKDDLFDALDLKKDSLRCSAPIESGSPQKPRIGAFSVADFRY